MTYDFLILGAGIFGISTAIELRGRGHQVGILNPDQIPHPLAASTDISKIVRMEYGSDLEYMKMADQAIDGWRAWNEMLGTTLYHETGFLLLCKQPMDSGAQNFEWSSYNNLIECGKRPQRLDEETIVEHLPGVRPGIYLDGFFHDKAGFAESGRAIEVLAAHARKLGVSIHEGQTAEKILIRNGRATGVRTREGAQFDAGQVIVCTGAFTPFLLPELKPYFKITGHPVFHIQTNSPDLFRFGSTPVFALDISNSGWYGFPTHPKEKVIKIANHGKGLELHPEKDERKVYTVDHEKLRRLLVESIPSLAGQSIVYTRRCVYTDTLDGHFWIDRHPEIEGLTIGTGGSGHGYKMGPVLGRLIASAALGEPHQWLERFRWRKLTSDIVNAEEARSKAES